MNGNTILHYKILEKLGEGGMGVVYKAHDAKLRRDVAIKFLPRKIAASDEERLRFQTEAQAAASLSHANIATIHTIEEVDDEAFIVMEFIDGNELKAVIERHPEGLPLTDAGRYAAQIAEGLAAAHKKQIIHRDIKSSNIMITGEGQIKIMDFGLAKISGGAQVTQAGSTLGTAAYMSPEQARSEETDQRSDIWSLGVVFYEMLTGKLPFGGDYDQAITYAILNEDPIPANQHRAGISVEVMHVVDRALEKDPADRYQSVDDLLIDLRRARRDKSPSGTATAVLAPGDQATAVAAGATATTNRREEAGAPGKKPGAAQGGKKQASPISKRTVLTGGALTLIVLAFLLFRALQPHDPGQASGLPTAFTQLTFQAGQEAQPDISPDGNFIVYNKSGDIFLQRIGGGNPINLTQTPDRRESTPTFSPDGQLIAFRADGPDDDGGIYIIGATGESVRRLTDFGYNPAWSPDGSEIAVAEERINAEPGNRTSVSGLWALNAGTGEKRRVLAGDAVQPAWSPNGHRIAYWGVPYNSGQRDLWTAPAAGGEAIAVTDDIHLDWNPVWSPDARYLYFSSDRGGSLNIWRIAIDEESGKTLGEPEAVTTPARESFHVRVSRDGSRMIFVARDRRANLAVLPFDPVTEKIAGPAQQITRSTKRFSQPAPSPDGQWVAVVENKGVRDDIYLIKSDGSETRQLTNDVFRNRAPSWSADGSAIAFYSNRNGRYDVWRIGADGSNLEQLTQTPDVSAWFPSLFADNKRLAYINDRGTFLIDLTQPLEKRQPAPVPVLPDPSTHFLLSSLSSDDRYMVGRRRDAEGQIMAGIVVLDFESRHYSILDEDGLGGTWLNDNRRILFGIERELCIVDRITGEKRVVGGFPYPALVSRFGAAIALSGDNRKIYFMEYDTEADIWMAELQGENRSD